MHPYDGVIEDTFHFDCIPMYPDVSRRIPTYPAAYDGIHVGYTKIHAGYSEIQFRENPTIFKRKPHPTPPTVQCTSTCLSYSVLPAEQPSPLRVALRICVRVKYHFCVL